MELPEQQLYERMERSLAVMEEAIKRAADAVETLLKSGVDQAMSRYNG